MFLNLFDSKMIFLSKSVLTRIWVLLVVFAMGIAESQAAGERVVPLNGAWRFALDAGDAGLKEKWFETNFDREAWRIVQVPHTWQVEPENTDYYGVAWYARTVQADPGWRGESIRLEFDAVYRDAWIWVNGKPAGEHLGSGWTPFGFSIEKLWRPGEENHIAVRVDNRFSEKALPYLRSSDWAADGGIIRRARLRLLPAAHIDRIHAHAFPKISSSTAEWEASVHAVIPVGGSAACSIEARLLDPDGRLASSIVQPAVEANPGRIEAQLSGVIANPQLWHFDYPHLYRLSVRLKQGENIIHEKEASFGVRSVELKDGYVFLNGEPMRLMGVEWMPGSDPRYGMAESPDFMRGVLRDMKRLNCLLTRFHWQQDDAVFEFCDREGILVQEEVPAWGPKTMEGEFEEIQEIHTREMMDAHYNHPSIFAWGLCNEIGGQSEAAHKFIAKGKELARRHDQHRPLTYASNSLQSNHDQDASKQMDFIEWNDYYESWYGGSVQDVEANLEKIAEAYPGQSLVISEYGLCECNPKNPTSDERRIEILKTHTEAYRNAPNVAGAIFFDYNDYRTHIGDKGQGSFQQRVHGVVDLLGRRKPSWEALRRESSPIRAMKINEPVIADASTQASVEIVTRSLENDLPAYTLRGYLLTWIAYNDQNLPIGTGKRILPDLEPGSIHKSDVAWPTGDSLSRVWVEVFRPTGYSVLDAEWRASE
ncbi:MAG: hypothetical protein JXR73_04345 [Candidatus Omnitrophica bacterium]|nr:hypothetical protein [Candidatus Omnitrophota bacterium]